ncbi:hypothetical protein [Streptomyces sp. NRRL S-87]|uniref:hypothetical protein n=1 Tax=Streptomyces sp. NRRL S-87 TaxID=1463920 RepID=UPI00055D3150|nr:hypothetical protein [Streptomyces sp. NRRL S-87]
MREDPAEPAGEDTGGSLYVLSAVLLTPAQFPSVLGDDYVEACAMLGLTPYAEGYGLVLGQDGDGARWTVIVDDVSLVAVAIASWDCGMEYDLSPDERTIVSSLAGWPIALAVAAPGLPDPHDPEQGADGTNRVPLAPPASDAWGPAQRRQGADEIAVQWNAWRAQFDLPTEEDAAEAETTGDDAPGDDAPGTGTGAGAGAEGDAAPGDGPRYGHDGVRRVLDELRAYTETPPPPGRIRSSFGTEEARTLRVDGPGWSLVARTDDIAFVLLDDEPGGVVPIGRGAELPGLLAALDEIAVRPSS